jgi:GntR family transcriptional regulator, transcriptional repressor for pyruvate dehydrogenase complex
LIASRRILEVEIAGLAAENRTDEDLAEMEWYVDEMEQMVNQEAVAQVKRENHTRNDVAFHTALAEATHNALFPLVLNSLADIMLEVRLLGFYVPGAPLHALEAHRNIFQAVRASKPAEARLAMEKHLAASAEILRQGIELRRAEEEADRENESRQGGVQNQNPDGTRSEGRLAAAPQVDATARPT